MVTIQVVRSEKRYRSIGMRIVGQREVELRVPSFIEIEQISSFLSQHTSFLSKSSTMPMRHTKNVFKEGDTVTIWGKEMRITFQKSRKIRTEITEESRVVTVFKPGLPVISKTRLYKTTNVYLLPILETLSAKAQELLSIDELQEIRIKNVRSIWGSCSRRGYITYNTRLIHYPADALWYIVCHEVSHLIVKNHSQSFWDVVAKICPSYKQQRQVLKKHLYG